MRIQVILPKHYYISNKYNNVLVVLLLVVIETSRKQANTFNRYNNER